VTAGLGDHLQDEVPDLRREARKLLGAELLDVVVALIRLRWLVMSVLPGEDEIRDLTEPLTFDPHKTNSRLGGGNLLDRKPVRVL
jgi:hypothetical protein